MRNVVFVGLKVFSADGGIEQVSRNWIFALSQLQNSSKFNLLALSLYDSSLDSRYVSSNSFRGMSGKRINFLLIAMRSFYKADTIVCSHIHLAPLILLAKIIKPSAKVMLQLHGIEAWNIKSFVQRIALRISDRLLPVSEFTKAQVLKSEPIAADSWRVIPNSLSPFATSALNKQLKIPGEATAFKLLTVCRLNSAEKYKGYDRVIAALEKFEAKNWTYTIVGKADKEEHERVQALIDSKGLQQKVRLTGYLSEEDLQIEYQNSNAFIMPSTGEGFGLVFLDAMAQGLPVIAGNQDGSPEALLPSPWCITVNPESEHEILEAIRKNYRQPIDLIEREQLSKDCLSKFSSMTLMENIKKVVIEFA